MDATATAPAPQHMRALERANRVRLARAELKRQVATGERSAASVVTGVPWEAESMTVYDLLMAQHRWGHSRAQRFLRTVHLSEAKTIGRLTERQRGELAARLSGEGTPSAPSVPVGDYLQQPL